MPLRSCKSQAATVLLLSDFGYSCSLLMSWLAVVQVSYIDLIQTHDIEFGDLDQVSGNSCTGRVHHERLCIRSLCRGMTSLQVVTETLPALQKLKQTGLVRHIGITGLPLKIFPAVLDRWA